MCKSACFFISRFLFFISRALPFSSSSSSSSSSLHSFRTLTDHTSDWLWVPSVCINVLLLTRTQHNCNKIYHLAVMVMRRCNNRRDETRRDDERKRNTIHHCRASSIVNELNKFSFRFLSGFGGRGGTLKRQTTRARKIIIIIGRAVCERVSYFIEYTLCVCALCMPTELLRLRLRSSAQFQ